MITAMGEYAFEAAVVAFIVAVFISVAFVTLKPRHRDVDAWHVVAGAAIYGAIIGLVIAFIVLPMRMLLINGDAPPATAALGAIFVFLTMFSLRRGLVGRIPFLGPQVRAFRRAQLRKTIETAQEQLDGLLQQPDAAGAKEK